MKNGIICVLPVNPRIKISIPYPDTTNRTHFNCEKCNAVSYIGPKQLIAKKENPEMQVICYECVFENTELLNDLQIKTMDEFSK